MDVKILIEALRERSYDVDNFSEASLRLIYDVMDIVENPPVQPKVKGRRLS